MRDLPITLRHRVIALTLALAMSGCAQMGGDSTGPDYDNGGRRAVTVTQTGRGAQITSDERILFDTGKSQINDSGKVFLDRIAKLLTERTDAAVAIEGHTDSVGGSAYNQALSEARAASVKDGLVKRGVAAERLSTAGFGMTRPVADNTTPEGRQNNRRTEIIVLGENAARLGGAGLAGQLMAGLDRFLQDAGSLIKNVFGSDG